LKRQPTVNRLFGPLLLLVFSTLTAPATPLADTALRVEAVLHQSKSNVVLLSAKIVARPYWHRSCTINLVFDQRPRPDNRYDLRKKGIQRRWIGWFWSLGADSVATEAADNPAGHCKNTFARPKLGIQNLQGAEQR